MSDYTAKHGLKTEIRLYNSGTDTYDFIPWATNIMMPGITTDFMDATTNTSPNGFKETVPGLKDIGDITFTLNWHDDEDTHQALWDLQQASELASFQIALPQFDTNNLFDFDAFISGLPISSPIDGLVTQAVTLKGTGNIEKSTE